MQFKKTFAILAVTAAVSAEDVNLWVKSDNSEVNGKGLSSLHEGAGINYFFLGDGTISMTYDATTGLVSESIGSGIVTSFGAVGDHFAASSVTTPYFDVTFEDDGTLQANGSSDVFYACQNTGDPYQYSTSQWEVMYYPAKDAPEGCLPITLINKAEAPSNSSSGAQTSTTETTTLVTVTSCSEGKCTSSPATQSSSATASTTPNSVTTFVGAAANAIEPAGAAAVFLAVFAALL
ncbi:DEKNAAC105653 [Brettanomyces naardenensis]|uniref:DEKNAAC105653 n=1 Tax=Brettanomyces naardenensis TaxID=13370 RepID=A0A448YTP3_BRENA|nr:DEKNAAC105653 [Brettanomyces naardenensis]